MATKVLVSGAQLKRNSPVVSETIYGAVNDPVLKAVPLNSRRILDVGCGVGSLGEHLKQRQECEVTGITLSQTEAELAAQKLNRVWVCDLNDFEINNEASFDCIVCSHVLEHVLRPDQVLQRLTASLSENGTLIVALPNVLFWRQRLNFLRGQFRYTEGGLMDRTHYRFYDWKSARSLLEDSGLRIVQAKPDGSFPLSRFLSKVGSALDRLALRSLPGLFGHQFIFVCRK